MIEIVGIRFKQIGKIYYFDPSGKNMRRGTGVIVETSRGVEYGTVEIPNKKIPEKEVVQPLKKVMRIATKSDEQKIEQNKIREKEAFDICQQKIKEHGLNMKLTDVELTFDLTKILFYFTSDNRIDFRELVKDLASIFRMRIELRQIGVRDEAKMLNSVAICGRPLCCSTFLGDFQSVSIKMAKDQGMSLNPAKISGICGRLMCCLKYEEETYMELTKNLPSIGDSVKTPDGKGEVISVNVLRQLVKVAIKKTAGGQDDPVLNFYSINEIEMLSRKPKPKNEGKVDPELLAIQE
ncbi:MAG: stage 0 sporulation family protein [Defluviitaleaceae bacterium]|nr:stage 0 sporulation family protein [Defluviitaleaceae bacterium]